MPLCPVCNLSVKALQKHIEKTHGCSSGKKECLECGGYYSNLGAHLWRRHGEGVNHRPSTGSKKPWNRGLNKKVDERLLKVSISKIGVATKPSGWKMSKESRAKISVAMRGNTNARHRGQRLSYRGLAMRSSWEVKVAEYLDSKRLEWRYEEICYPLSSTRSYRPDFFVYESQKLIKIIEVKGFWREENRKKFEEFRSLYPEIPIEVWDKEVLKSLGLKI